MEVPTPSGWELHALHFTSILLQVFRFLGQNVLRFGGRPHSKALDCGFGSWTCVASVKHFSMRLAREQRWSIGIVHGVQLELQKNIINSYKNL